MSSRTKNFRRRADDEDNDDDTPNGTVPPSTSSTRTSKSTTATTKPKKPTTPHHQAPKKLLSFAQDDDEDDSPVSRPLSKSKPSSSSSSRLNNNNNKPSSSSSHKHTSSKDRPPPPPSNVQPLSGTYTPEALLELRKNTRTLVPSSSSHHRPPPSEPVVLLKGLVKPVSETLKQADELDRNDDDREEEATTAQLAGIGLGNSFPDQATINAIRARRERQRQSRAAAPDFISLDGGSNHGEAEGLSDEEPEFRGRIGFFGDRIEKKKGVFDNDDGVGERVVAMEGVGFRKEVVDEEEEEDKIWEEEQFRKGLGKRMDEASSSGGRVVGTSSNSVALPVVAQSIIPQQKYAYAPAVASYPSVPSIGGVVGELPGLEVMSIPQQAEVAKKALHDNLKRMKESHGRTMASLDRNDENLTTSLLKVTALEKSLSAAGERFIFMQKLRDFVSVICDFLQHKAPFIEELEEQMQKLNEDRAAAILKRRSSDNDDEMLELEAAINAAMSVFSKGGGSAAMIEVATREAKAASSATKEQRNLPVELDEFGRDTNLQKRMDMTRRADVRRTRTARSDAKRLSSMGSDGPYQQIEGESSTDESDSETAAYESNRDLLLQTAEQVFSDAAEEYSQLAVVIERFDSWKKDYPSSYRDAYMSLSVPAIFSPYVRLELLKWDPLHEDTDFIDMNWHSLLYSYGIEDENDISPDDDDANLVPQLVEKVAVPILHHEIAHCWDMLSTHETRNAVLATELVVRYVPASSESLIELVAVLHDHLADAIADLAVPTWSPLVLKAVPNAARVAAYRFGRSVRLMRNICMWNKIIALPVLERLVLDDLLSGKVLPHLRSIQSNVHDAVTRSERVIASLCGVWAGPSAAGQRSPKLQPLVDYLLTLERTLQKKHVSGVSEGETSGLARRLKKMLVELNEYDHARAISRTFNLKEAL
ncbi:transcriptional repressor ILP1 [Rhododendron vialii]|uniref:transcriptional repressor ILP1 n=1 Tax=Rhododendron vialii TaxID=182163 RepID=UPI00265EEA17|nr:transcriptional repressor ILP1 [Rhododendron vialii]